MAVRDWRAGRIAAVWAAALFVASGLWGLGGMEALPPALVLLMFFLPLAALGLTCIWLAGRRR